MSLVLRSNNIATKSLGNINGLPSQDYALFLDFARQEYKAKINNVLQTLSESDVLVCTSTKSLAAQVQTLNRTTQLYEPVSTANQLRWWKTPNNEIGLLIEADQTNWFRASNAPVTQVISNIPAGSNLIASVIGTGSMTITGDGIDTIIVTQDKPQTITPQRQSTVLNLTATISGSLSHAQIVRAAGHTGVRTPLLSTASSLRPSGFDNVEIKPELLASVLSNPQSVTILIQTSPIFETKETIGSLPETRLVLETVTQLAALGLNKTTNNSHGSRIVSYIKADNSIQANVGGTGAIIAENSAVTQVFSLSSSGVKAAINGQALLKAEAAVGLTQLTKLGLASHIASPNNQGGNCIFTKLAIFNKALTDAEILEYSKSWN